MLWRLFLLGIALLGRFATVWHAISWITLGKSEFLPF
jgi:hypothetical protein